MYPICIASTGLGFYFLEVRSYGKGAKARFPPAKSECAVMSSMFVASQSSCFFLCSRNQIRLVENKLKRKGAGGGGGGRHQSLRCFLFNFRSTYFYGHILTVLGFATPWISAALGMKRAEKNVKVNGTREMTGEPINSFRINNSRPKEE